MYFKEILLLLLSCLSLSAWAAPNYHVHIFYYGWYDNPDGAAKIWSHWDQHNHKPENKDIGSNFYPSLGLYDSCDPKVLEQHMTWISEAGIGVIVVLVGSGKE